MKLKYDKEDTHEHSLSESTEIFSVGWWSILDLVDFEHGIANRHAWEAWRSGLTKFSAIMKEHSSLLIVVTYRGESSLAHFV